jgi:hypothetical protein
VYEGAADLDIPPAENGKTVQVCRIWCDAGTEIVARLVAATAGWTANTQIVLELRDPSGAVVGSHAYGGARPPLAPLRSAVRHVGWHTARLEARGLPSPSGQCAYHLSLSYTAPQASPLT